MLILGQSNLTHAQTTEEVEKPNVYHVELLIFRHMDQTATTGEIPRMPEPELADLLAEDLARLELADAPLAEQASAADSGLPESEANTAVAEMPPYWRLLPAEQLALNDVSAKLNRLDAYELLDHRGWIQTAADVTTAEDLPLSELGIDELLATGNVKLFKRRYLHLAVDIALADAAANSSGNDDLFSDAFQAFAAPKAMPAIADSRRIRLEKLVYFDQPQFGILAMVARSELAIERDVDPTVETTNEVAASK
jgi:hypothetical protein